MLKDYKKFIMRGNVVDLAVAVAIGASFSAIITALTKDMITPLITAIFGDRTSFTSLSFKLHGATFQYGEVINAIITFVIVATVIFFLVVQPINKLTELTKRGKNIEPTDKQCPECLSTVPIKATRCAFCTVKLKET